MARSFGNTTTNNLRRSASINAMTDPRPISISCWLYPLSRTDKGNGYSHWILTNNWASGDPALGLSIRLSGANDVLALYSGANVTSSTFNLAVNSWNHLCWTWASSNTVSFYFNGSAIGTATRTLLGSGLANVAAIGSLEGTLSGFTIDGSLAEFAAWNVVLSASEVAALASGVNARNVSPSALTLHLPLWGIHSPEIDLIGGATWSINGTINAANHAPVVPSTQPHWAAAPLIDVGGAAPTMPPQMTRRLDPWRPAKTWAAIR